MSGSLALSSLVVRFWDRLFMAHPGLLLIPLVYALLLLIFPFSRTSSFSGGVIVFRFLISWGTEPCFLSLAAPSFPLAFGRFFCLCSALRPVRFVLRCFRISIPWLSLVPV